jgi:nucleotide-binding universal stress UspA family protein
MGQLFRKILCPVDFDDNSIAALDLACRVAEQNDASLCLIHVIPFPVAPLVPGNVGAVPSSFPIWEQEAKVKLEQIGQARIPNTIRYETVSIIGLPAEVIVRAEAERDVDLVVMATHGRSRSVLGHFFIGSVAERVVRESLCPVLIVPPRQAGLPK